MDEIPLSPDLNATVETGKEDFKTQVLREQAMVSAGVVPDAPDLPPDDDGAARTPEQLYARAQGKKLDGFAEYLAAQWEIGKQDVVDGVLYSTAAAGLKTYEEVENEIKADKERPDVGALQARTSIFESEHFWKPPEFDKNNPQWRKRSAEWFTNFVQGIPGAVMRSMAFSGAVMASGTAAGALTGGAGFGIGAFNAAAQILTGLSYRDLRKQNVPHERAQKLAIASGTIQAVIESIQVGQLLRLGKKAYKNAIRSPQVQTGIRGTVLRVAWDNGVQANEEYAQEWTQVITEFLGKVGDNVRLPTQQEWREAVKRTNEAWVGGLQGAIGQTTGAKAIGGAARILKNKTNPTEIDFGKATMAEIQYEQNSQRVEQKVSGQVLDTGETTGGATATVKESETTQQAKEKLDVAKELRVKASQHLETVLYEIEQIKDLGEEIPAGLIEKRKQAYRDLKDAQHREKKAKLKVAKSEAQDVIDTRGASDAVKEAAMNELTAVEEKRAKLYEDMQAEKRERVETDLKAQIELLEKEFQKVNANDVEATQNIAKQLHQAELKLMLLQSGLLSKQIEKMLIDSERDSIIKRGIGDLSFTAFVRAWNIARASTNIAKEEALKNRKLLTEIVKSSGLTTAEQGKFLTFIKNGTLTQNTLDTLTRRINEVIDKRERKQAREDLVSLIDRVTRERVAPNKAAVPVETQAILTGYKQMSELSAEEIEALATQPINENEETEIEPGALSPFMQRIIANDLMSVIDKNADVSDINALYDKIEAIYKTGRAEQFKRQEEIKEQNKKNVVAFRAAMRGKKHRKPLQQMNPLLRTAVEIKRLGWTRGVFNIWHTHAATLFQHAATDEQYDELREMISIDKEGRERRANTSRFINKMFDFVLTREGKTKRDKKLHALMIHGAHKKQRAGFRDPISDNELIQLYLQTQDDILATRIKATYNESAESLGARIAAILSPDQLYIAKRLQQFYQQYYKRINAHHIKEFGYSLRHNKQYSGRAIGVDTGEGASYTDFLTALEEHRSILPSSIRKRTNNRHKLKTVDAFSNAINHIEDMETWRAYSGKVALLEMLFKNERVKQDIVDKFGSAYYDRVVKSYRRAIGLERIPRGELDKYYNAIRGNYAMFMAGKIDQYAKQSTGLIIYLKYVSPTELVAGLEDYIHNFEEANKRLRDTDFFEDRKYNITPEIKASLSTATAPGLSGLMQRILLLPVSQTDTVVNSVGMWAIYQKGLKAGLSESEAMAAAERAADESQSSAGEHHKTSFELDGGINMLLSTLSKQNVQTSNLSTTAWRRAISNPTRKNVLEAFNTSMALHSSQAAFALTGAAFKIALLMAFAAGDDDDEKIDEKLNAAITDYVDNITFGSHLGLPVIGALQKAILTGMWNTAFPDLNKNAWAPSIAGLDAAEDLTELIRDIEKAGVSEVPIDEIDLGNFWVDWHSSGAVLVPFEKIVSPVRALIGLNSIAKALVWLYTDPEYEADKKKARREGEPL